jgi:hypothetical protein
MDLHLKEERFSEAESGTLEGRKQQTCQGNLQVKTIVQLQRRQEYSL